MGNLKPRFNNHDPVNDVLRQDWIKAIQTDPNNYDALLYLPKEEEKAVADELYESLEVTKLDENQKALDYGDPEIVTIVDNNEPIESFETDESGTTSHINNDGLMIVKIAHYPVPIGSILEWTEEQQSGDTKRVWWYVQAIKSYGTTNVGQVHYLIPCRDFKGMVNG